MGVVTEVDAAEARTMTEAALLLSPGSELVLVIAESLRRAASVRCPLTRRNLEDLTCSALSAIVDVSAEQVGEVVEVLLSIGDLVEARPEPLSPRSQVFLGPLRYVRRRDESVVLLGIRADAADFLPEALADRVHRLSHLRLLDHASRDDRELLIEHGFLEVPENVWLQHEEPIAAADLLQVCEEALDRQGHSGDVDGLTILDPKAPTSFYRRRWRTPDSNDDGIFVGRRPQRYGSDLWTLVRLHRGAPTKMIDLPIFPRQRGCDDAWRLQAAIDASRSNPQVAHVSGTGKGRIQVGLPSPPPRWLQRRWDLLGTPAAMRGALVTYEFDAAIARDELDFLKTYLWMRPTA